MSCFDSANGPSMTARFPPESRTRLPMALGRSPARSMSTPASLSSSLYLPISPRSSSLGAAPGCGSPLIINITRMPCLLPIRAGPATTRRSLNRKMTTRSGLLHFMTRKVRCVTPAPSITLVRSRSIGPVPRWSNNRTPPPSRTGTRSRCISSRSPALMHCCTMLAAPTPTSLSPATAFACSRALSTPSVTNVNGDPWSTHAGGAELLTTKTGTSKGCLPPHPWVRSKVRRPNTNAPVISRVSRRNSAVWAETLKTMSVPGSRYSVSPAPYHATSRSPPCPMGASGPSFGPLINPSSETASPVRTFPMFVLLPHCLHEVSGPQLGRHESPQVGGQASGSMPEALHTPGSVIRAAARRSSHGDDGFPLGGPLSDIPDRLRGLAQREGSVDDRRDLPGFDELLQDHQVRSPWLGQERAQPLADEPGHHHRPEGATGPHQPPTPRSSDQHQRPGGGSPRDDERR